MNLNWHPLNYDDLPNGTPIVVIMLGTYGTCQDVYAREYAWMVN